MWMQILYVAATSLCPSSFETTLILMPCWIRVLAYA
jgi:hypothetical protein